MFFFQILLVKKEKKWGGRELLKLDNSLLNISQDGAIIMEEFVKQVAFLLGILITDTEKSLDKNTLLTKINNIVIYNTELAIENILNLLEEQGYDVNNLKQEFLDNEKNLGSSIETDSLNINIDNLITELHSRIETFIIDNEDKLTEDNLNEIDEIIEEMNNYIDEYVDDYFDCGDGYILAFVKQKISYYEKLIYDMINPKNNTINKAKLLYFKN